jgi:uncharacterized membrane protein YciS (DUF1049 family)
MELFLSGFIVGVLLFGLFKLYKLELRVMEERRDIFIPLPPPPLTRKKGE